MRQHYQFQRAPNRFSALRSTFVGDGSFGRASEAAQAAHYRYSNAAATRFFPPVSNTSPWDIITRLKSHCRILSTDWRAATRSRIARRRINRCGPNFPGASRIQKNTGALQRADTGKLKTRSVKITVLLAA